MADRWLQQKYGWVIIKDRPAVFHKETPKRDEREFVEDVYWHFLSKDPGSGIIFSWKFLRDTGKKKTYRLGL